MVYIVSSCTSYTVLSENGQNIVVWSKSKREMPWHCQKISTFHCRPSSAELLDCLSAVVATASQTISRLYWSIVQVGSVGYVTSCWETLLINSMSISCLIRLSSTYDVSLAVKELSDFKSYVWVCQTSNAQLQSSWSLHRSRSIAVQLPNCKSHCSLQLPRGTEPS